MLSPRCSINQMEMVIVTGWATQNHMRSHEVDAEKKMMRGIRGASWHQVMMVDMV